MYFGFKRIASLLAGAGIAGALAGCTNVIVGGLTLERDVSYPMRSPEVVLRRLDGDRFLLAQWRVGVNTNIEQATRFYDRRNGIVSQLPNTVAVGWRDNDEKIHGDIRYESDNPLHIAFLENRETGYNSSCDDPYKPLPAGTPKPLCGYMDVILSLDGGRSFAGRRVKIPSTIGNAHIRPDAFKFAIVRKNAVYFGLALSQPRSTEDALYTRRYTRMGESDSSDTPLVMLVLPLPAIEGKPLSAEEIPRGMSANRLTGSAFWSFDIGQMVARSEMQLVRLPKRPYFQFTQEDRRQYIESMRGEYPVWAAHQTLNGLPKTRQSKSSDAIRALREKLWNPNDDPLEWVQFDRVDAR